MSRTERFLALSEALTGFPRAQLLGTDMTQTYLARLDQAASAATVDELLAAGAEDGGGEAVMTAILSDPKLGPVARSLILMWYCGTWNALPAEWRSAHGGSTEDASGVVSSQAYVTGLQWVAAGAHPVGARQQGFGAWAVPPEPTTLRLRGPARNPGRR